jgi:flagella basal body P-ring formation protein FlgA
MKMKKIFNLALILILFLSSLITEAYGYLSAYEDKLDTYEVKLTLDEVKSIIAQKVEKEYKNYTDAQLDIQVVTLPFQYLYLPKGQMDFIVKSSSDKFMPRDLEKVSVYVNGKCIKKFNAPIVVKAYKDVLVASQFINIDKPLNSTNVTVKKLEVSNVLEYQLKPDVLKKEILSQKAFREGEIIDKRFIKFKPDVLRNAPVVTIFKTNNLTISMESVALSNGLIGDTICVMNKHYNRIYKGEVIDENKVLVKI